MTYKDTTKFQQIANNKGWTFVEIAKRWGKSERQMSRIAKAEEPRDIDAVNGLPINIKKQRKLQGSNNTK